MMLWWSGYGWLHNSNPVDSSPSTTPGSSRHMTSSDRLPSCDREHVVVVDGGDVRLGRYMDDRFGLVWLCACGFFP